MVCGFVEEGELPAASKDLRKKEAVLFPSREVADAVVDAFVPEEKALQVRSHRDRLGAEADRVLSLRDFLEDALVFVEGEAGLVDVVEFGAFADADSGGGGPEFAEDEVQQGGFAEPIPTGPPGAFPGPE